MDAKQQADISLKEVRCGMIIDLTESQCRNLCDFIEVNIFEYIRNDTEIDNIGWLIDMMETYKKLKGGGTDD